MDDSDFQCSCGCADDPKKFRGLDLGAVRLSFEFSFPEATILRSLIEVALYALRDKRSRLQAMEPSWTIGPDDLRMLRDATERRSEEGEALLRRLIAHPAAQHFHPPKDRH